jgi:hypothetical protein
MAPTRSAPTRGSRRDTRPCRWCGRPFAVSTVGRPRQYCRHSCRQRDYEARRRAAELGLGEHDLVVTRQELEALRDRLYVLECAVDDVERDLAAGATAGEVREALAWLLDAARHAAGRDSVVDLSVPSRSGPTDAIDASAEPSHRADGPADGGGTRRAATDGNRRCTT